MTYMLRLYVTGMSARSTRAIANLRQICAEQSHFEYELEIIDVLENPELAEEEKILVTPTLLRTLPPPRRRVLGDLSNSESVLAGLDIARRSQTG